MRLIWLVYSKLCDQASAFDMAGVREGMQVPDISASAFESCPIWNDLQWTGKASSQKYSPDKLKYLFSIASGYHRAGLLKEAEKTYRKILADGT